MPNTMLSHSVSRSVRTLLICLQMCPIATLHQLPASIRTMLPQSLLSFVNEHENASRNIDAGAIVKVNHWILKLDVASYKNARVSIPSYILLHIYHVSGWMYLKMQLVT